MDIKLPIKINLNNKQHILEYRNEKYDLYSILNNEVMIFDEDGVIDIDDTDIYHDDYDTIMDDNDIWIIYKNIRFYFEIKNSNVFLTKIRDNTKYKLNFENIKINDIKLNWYLVEKKNTLVIKDSDYKNNYIDKNKILCNNSFKPYCFYVSHISDSELNEKIKLLNHNIIKYPPTMINDGPGSIYTTYSGSTSFYDKFDNTQLYDGYINFIK